MAGHFSIRTAPAVSAERCINKPRVYFGEVFVTETEPHHYIWTKALDQNVRGCDQLHEDALPARISQVDRHALLSPVGFLEEPRSSLETPCRIARWGPFDLDDFSSKTSELHGSHGTR